MRNVPHRDLGTPTHICILMLVDPMEIERFPVNEELALCHSHSANPHRESVEVRHRPRCRLCSQLYLEKPSTGMRHSRWPEPRIAYPSAGRPLVNHDGPPLAPQAERCRNYRLLALARRTLHPPSPWSLLFKPGPPHQKLKKSGWEHFNTND